MYKLHSIEAVKMGSWEARTPDNDHGESLHDFITAYEGPFPGSLDFESLSEVLPGGLGFIPDIYPQEYFDAGIYWWCLGVVDERGRRVDVLVDKLKLPNDDPADPYYTIYCDRQIRTTKELKELLDEYEPKITEWWENKGKAMTSKETEKC